MKDYVIDFKHLNNARSLSYLKNKNGKRIKNNLLIRSDNLSQLSKDECKLLRERYQISRVIDLRTPKEIKNKPDQVIEGAEYFSNSILPSDKIGISKEKDEEETFEVFVKVLQEAGLPSSDDFMERTYESLFTSDFCIQAYRQFLDLVLESNGPVLWHCSAGKDRAGFATILLLTILDFDIKDIKDDYLLTNHFYEEIIQNNIKHFGSEYEGILRCIFGVKESYFTTLMEKITNRYGSINHFINEKLDFSEEKQQLMKNKFLEV